jgi:hypothetical protein
MIMDNVNNKIILYLLGCFIKYHLNGSFFNRKDNLVFIILCFWGLERVLPKMITSFFITKSLTQKK